MQKVIIITDSDVNSHSLGKEIQNQTLGSPLKNVTSFLFWGRGSIRFFFSVIYLLASRVFSCSRWNLFSYGIQTLSCGIWDLTPWPGIEFGPPALGAQSISHWTTREVPMTSLIKDKSQGKWLGNKLHCSFRYWFVVAFLVTKIKYPDSLTPRPKEVTSFLTKERKAKFLERRTMTETSYHSYRFSLVFFLPFSVKRLKKKTKTLKLFYYPIFICMKCKPLCLYRC